MKRPRFVSVIVAAIVIASVVIFFRNFTISGFNKIEISPRGATAKQESTTVDRLKDGVTRMITANRRTIASTSNKKSDDKQAQNTAKRLHVRIGTFNIQAFDLIKVEKPHVLDIVARIGREFDVLAVQEIQTEADDVLPRIVRLMNKTAQGSYDFAIGPRVGPHDDRIQYGFIFNRKTIQIDRSELYTVDDPDDLLTYEPFVAWFRAIGPREAEAFTFSIVNLRIDPTTAAQELDIVDDLMFAVREDGRGEDDVILAGSFTAGPGSLGDVDRLSDVGFAVVNVPTDVNATRALDNLAFQKSATEEFTGNSGVFDFLREYNLSLDEAIEVSEHFPVWADFDVFEGGQPGRVASHK